MLGGFLNVEGVDLRLRGKNPTVIPVDRLGIPTYDELVAGRELRPARRTSPQTIELFIAALERGTQAAVADPAAATEAVLDGRPGPRTRRITAAEMRKTLPLLLDRGQASRSATWTRSSGRASPTSSPTTA